MKMKSFFKKLPLEKSIFGHSQVSARKKYYLLNILTVNKKVGKDLS